MTLNYFVSVVFVISTFFLIIRLAGDAEIEEEVFEDDEEEEWAS